MHLSLPRRRAGWIICFFSKISTGSGCSVSGSQEGLESHGRINFDHTHPPSRQQAAVGGSRASSKATHAPSAKLWKQVNVHRTLRPLHGPPRARSLHSTSLPYCGYVGGPDGPACTVSGCRELPSRLAGSWGPSDSAMRFSSPGVLPSSGASTSQQWRQPMPMTCERNLCPTGEGRDGTGPSSRYEGRVFQPLLHCAQEKRWVTTNLGSAHLDAQDAHAEPRLRMHPSPSSVCSIDLKTRTSMCRSFRATGHSCGLRSKDEHISTGPALRAVPIAPCLHESSGGSPCSLERQGVRILNYLDDWLILAQSQDQLCEHRDWCSRTSASWAFGSTGKRANSCRCRGSLFSVWSLDSVNQTARLTQERAQSVLNCLNTFKNRTRHHWNSFRGSWGIWRLRRRSRAGAAPYETASTLAPWPSPEVGVAERHAEGPSHSSLPNLHPVVRPFIPSGRSAPGTGLQARCGLHDASAKGWGATFNGHAVSGVWTGPQLHWHQLPRVAGSTPGLEPSQETLTRRACTVRTDNTRPLRTSTDKVVYAPRMSQLARHLLLWSRKHLRSLRAIHIRACSTGQDRAVTSCAPRRMETPSPDGPADLATFWTRTGRPVRVPRDVALPVVLQGTLGTDALAHSWPRGLRKYAFPPVSLLAQTLCKVRRKRSRSCSWHHTGLPGLGSQSWCSSWQPLPGRFLWGRIYWLRDGAPYGTRVQTLELHVWSLDGTRRF